LLMAGDTGAQNRELRAPAAFAGITDPQARSRALFTEAAKAIMSPRCITLCPAPWGTAQAKRRRNPTS